MKTDQLINAGAIAFAVFAVYIFTRGSTAQASTLVSTQPGQVQRDNGAQAWMDMVTKQWADLNRQLPQATYDETDSLLKRYPAPAQASP